MKASRSLRARRGSSFIEILVSLAILAVVMVGILQMFSLALLTNLGSAARTDLLYKAQQVVENLRLIYFLQNKAVPSEPAARVAAGVPADLAVTASPIYLPYDSGGTDPMDITADDPDTDLTWPYWGPRGVNIVEAEKLPVPALLHCRGPDPRALLAHHGHGDSGGQPEPPPASGGRPPRRHRRCQPPSLPGPRKQAEDRDVFRPDREDPVGR